MCTFRLPLRSTPRCPPLFGGYWHVAWRRHLRDDPSHSKVTRDFLMRFTVTRRPASWRLLQRGGRILPAVPRLTESRASPRAVHAGARNPVRRRERYWRRSLTTLPLLAWQPSRVVPCICPLIRRRRIFVPRRTTPVSRAAEEPWRRRRRTELATRFQPRVLTGAKRREPKAQALSVTNVQDECPSAEDSPPGLSVYSTRRAPVKRGAFDPIIASRPNRATEWLCWMCAPPLPNTPFTLPAIRSGFPRP